MKHPLLTAFALFISFNAFSQQINQFFPSRLNYILFSPDIIINHHITSINVTDRFINGLQYNYEILFNRKGGRKGYIFSFGESPNESFTSKLDPLDNIFYNKTNTKDFKAKYFTLSIKYNQNGKIEKVVYDYRHSIIGCPISNFSFNYDSIGNLTSEILVTCLGRDSIFSAYIYRDKKIVSINSTNIRTDMYPSKKDTINGKFEIKYNTEGLPTSIHNLTKPDLFINYSYKFKN